MADAALRDLERALAAAPGDAGLVERVIAARRRAGLPVPHRLIEARSLPPFALGLQVGLEVVAWGRAGPGEPIATHHVGRAVPTERRWLKVPSRCAWSVRPLARDLGPPDEAALEELVAALAAPSWPEDDPPELLLAAPRLQ